MLTNPSHENIFQLKTAQYSPPGAGSNFSYPIFNSSRIQLLGLHFTFITDATAANRYVSIALFNGTYYTIVSPYCPAIAASLTTYVRLSVGGLNQYTAAIQTCNGILPDYMYADAGYSIFSMISNLQAGDSFTDITLTYKLWRGTSII